MTMQEQAVAQEPGGLGQVEASLRQEGKQRMAGNTLAFLRNFAPFNKMQADALQRFADNARITFFPAGSEIIGPDAGNVRYYHLIQSGKVQARQAGEVTVTEYSILSLGAGEGFPIGAVTAGRPSDETCWRISVPGTGPIGASTVPESDGKVPRTAAK